jgi:type II secretory pathway pseudopilin PulG
MKPIRFPTRRTARQGFSLVEGVFSLGVMSFGFLALAPLLVVGMKGAQAARETRTSAVIATGLAEQARQGVAVTGRLYFDSAGQSCAVASAAYLAQATVQPLSPPATTLSIASLRVTPLGRPANVRTYADVFPTP